MLAATASIAAIEPCERCQLKGSNLTATDSTQDRCLHNISTVWPGAVKASGSGLEEVGASQLGRMSS